MTVWIRGIAPEVIFCFGWSYLLGRDILEIPGRGVIGYHPALLPRNRGRHPIVWALALGLEETGSTFFVMDEGADSGDIVSQRRIDIEDTDDAGTLYAKLEDAARGQLDEIVGDLTGPGLKRLPQNPGDATHWRKRSNRDGEIDWRMPATGICNLVRALTRPYVGAHCLFHDAEHKVWKAAPATPPAADVEPGRVLSVTEGAITIKCGDGAVTLIDHDLPDLPKAGDCL
jgi:methionyl-tRNA formyltransferase